MDDPANGLFARRLRKPPRARPPVSGWKWINSIAKHVEAYFHGYMDPIEKALGPLVGKSLRYMVMDSWEAGMQNWTDDMIAEFTQRRGYDPRPYLPVLAGRVVGSAELSDRFLWDFRRTIADLLAEAHYGTMAELLRKRGWASTGSAGRLDGDSRRYAAHQEQSGCAHG